MTRPLIARLLLDAQSELVRAADAFPSETRNRSSAGFNAPGWVVAHAAFFHDVWIDVDAQGLRGDSRDPWLHDWFQRQRSAGLAPIETLFDDARSALGRVIERATPFIESLTDTSLEEVPDYEEGAWPAGTTIGYLVARDIAHLFAHASELNLIATSAGAPDMGLPGTMTNSSRSD